MFPYPPGTSSSNQSVKGAPFLITLPPASSRWRSHQLLCTQMLAHLSLMEVAEAEIKRFVLKPPNIQRLFRMSHDAFYPQLIMTALFLRHWTNCCQPLQESYNFTFQTSSICQISAVNLESVNVKARAKDWGKIYQENLLVCLQQQQ